MHAKTNHQALLGNRLQIAHPILMCSVTEQHQNNVICLLDICPTKASIQSYLDALAQDQAQMHLTVYNAT